MLTHYFLLLKEDTRLFDATFFCDSGMFIITVLKTSNINRVTSVFDTTVTKSTHPHRGIIEDVLLKGLSLCHAVKNSLLCLSNSKRIERVSGDSLYVLTKNMFLTIEFKGEQLAPADKLQTKEGL